jgi:hypothetical protein
MSRSPLNVLTLLVEFRGQGTPLENSPGFSVSEAAGPIKSVSGTVPGEVSPLRSAGDVRMKTRVFTLEGRFWESGEILFPQLGSLIVDSPAPGTVHQRPDGSSCGSITWRVLSGTGQLEGAQGIVTGNFTGDAQGGFIDHQVYNLLLAR